MSKRNLSFYFGYFLGSIIKLIVRIYIHSYRYFRNIELFNGFKKAVIFPVEYNSKYFLRSKTKSETLFEINKAYLADSSKRKVVYTCVVGDFDHVLPLTIKSPDCDFIIFSDNPDYRVPGWKTIHIENSFGFNNRMLSKMPKILPHRFLSSYNVSIWVDGNFQITGDISELFDYLGPKTMAVFSHPEGRTCIKEEGKKIIELGKAEHGNVNKQVESYFKEGFPENYGLYECNVLVREHTDPAVMEVMENWWGEIKTQTHRDQLSFPYVLWKTGLEVQILCGNNRDNDLFIRRKHA